MKIKKHNVICVLSLCSLSLVSGPQARAAAPSPSEGFDYPELMVTPRASERLALEARKEAESRWTTHLPLQVPALLTFVAGVMQDANLDKDPDNRARTVGIAVGGGWLAATVLLSAMYQPYSMANQEIAPMPNKSTRDQLTRERYSEEAIYRAGRLGTTLKWLSVVSNLGAGAYMVTQAKSNTFSMYMDIGVAVAALTPVLFPHRWTDVQREQADYKKRIYGPVANANLLPEPGTGKPVPGLTLSLNF